MTDKEDFIVQEPYQPTEEERQAIKELEDKEQGLVAGDWSSQKIYIKSFKRNFKNYMYKKQNELCAFCRIHAPDCCVPMHCEHIVYKNKHPQWTFLPENLCLACPLCNGYKGTAEVLVNPQIETYPNVGDGFKIIHPLYDRYSDHIELIGGVLYRGKTKKGVFTIDTCHLYRVKLAEERAKQRMYEENKGSIIAELIHLTTISNNYLDDQEDFLMCVKDIVKKYKLEQMEDNV